MREDVEARIACKFRSVHRVTANVRLGRPVRVFRTVEVADREEQQDMTFVILFLQIRFLDLLINVYSLGSGLRGGRGSTLVIDPSWGRGIWPSMVM